ncbi:beta-1 3-galactosyltransferase 1 [Biomphalaria pfeifferi]|uniref:Hexosyltransferase n=1 Tax=Biomphalaria pfeifferi TaxID=112525 RepID=A0AAD8BWM0_BIOPF|nr:beta-1 3-galactosyltransferase 1 [Biomphalaria pfeifferi]
MLVRGQSFYKQTCISVFFGGVLLISISSNFLNTHSDSKKTLCRSYANELNELSVRKEEVRTLKSVVSFLTEPTINEHSFSFIHNPKDTCSNSTNVLYVVPSAPTNFWRRSKVRQGFLGTHVGNSNGNAKLLFFLGKSTDEALVAETQASVVDEFVKHNDIVQEAFEDSRRNYRLKAVSMLKWPVYFCRDAKYVVRLDDDVEINIERLFAALKEASALYAHFVLGHRKDNGSPVRAPSDRMYISREEYPDRHFPIYIYGRIQAYPMAAVRLLYQAVLRVKPIWLEDVFITGLCALKVDVALVNLTGDEFKHVE